MEFFMQLFPGIGTFFAVEPVIAVARIVLIVFGFVLACLGFKRTLEPLIMVPMGIGMMAVNCGMMFLTSGTVGNLLLDPLVSDASAIVDAMQVNFLQPIYNLTFSNGLIACLVFMGIGARSEISFLLAKPWSSMIIAIFAEMGTFAALAAGVLAFGLTPEQSAAMATIGGADGPMVLFSSLMMAPELFVPISIIAYLYLSLTYGGYPYIIKLMVPKKYRGIDMYVEVPEVSQKSKFLFIIITCTVLCLLLPVAAPLLLSFFIGMAVKEAKINKYTELLEEGLSYFGTFFLGLILGVLLAILLGGCVAALFAWLIGLPVLRLKSDYLAIATLGFAEIIRAIFQWDRLGPVTNGANALKSFPTFSSFNIENANGEVVLRLSTFVPFLLVAVCIGIMVLLINSTYGRAFKAIREDEIAAEAMGINLAKHKRMAFCISSFFAGVGGGLFAMFANQAQAKTFTTSMTYEILLIVVIGGIGSISGSCIASFLYVAASEWWLRFLDTETYIGAFKVPFLRTGFRMVVFSIIIMIVVLFFRRGLMGDRELSDVARSLRARLSGKSKKKEAAK